MSNCKNAANEQEYSGEQSDEIARALEAMRAAETEETKTGVIPMQNRKPDLPVHLKETQNNTLGVLSGLIPAGVPPAPAVPAGEAWCRSYL